MRPALLGCALAAVLAAVLAEGSAAAASRGPLPGLAPAVAHPDSQSRTVLSWVDGRPQVELKVQVTSLAEVLPELGLDDQGELPPGALADGAASIRAYLAQHLSVVVDDAAIDLATGEVSFELPNGERSPDGWQWVVLRARGAPGPGVSAAVEMDLFLETSPGHLDTLVVRWPDALPAVEVLSAGSAEWQGRAGPSLRWTQAQEGLRAAASGVAWLCLLSLLCARGSRRSEASSQEAVRRGSGALPVIAWVLGAACAFWAPTERLGLEARTLGLASAIAAVYFGSDGLLNGARVRGGLDPLLAGAALGLGLSAHPEVLPAPLDPGGAVALFGLGGLLGGLVLALLAARILRPMVRSGGGARLVQAGITLAGLVAFGGRAFGGWLPGA